MLLPGPTYDAALPLWNADVQHRPALMVQCRSVVDVQAAVAVAQDHALPLSVRGAGNDWAGRALVQDGLVIDLRHLRDVTVDAGVAAAQGGATSADVVAAAEPHGLTAATGATGSVGMAGLTLGGGYGPLTGRAGLAADNLLGADVVLADGRLVTTDEDHEPELLWALRGGGGNFGVVTTLRVRLHPVTTVLTGLVAFPWEQAAQVLDGVTQLLAEAPDDLTFQLIVLPAPEGGPMLAITPTWSGDADAGTEVLAAVQRLGTPSMVQIAPVPTSTMLGLGDPFVQGGRHYAIRTTTLAALTPGSVAALVAAGGSRTSPLSMVSIKQFHGAATRVAEGATAVGLRTEHLVVEIIAAWQGGDGGEHRAWADDLARSLGPYSVPGGYPSLLTADRYEQLAHAYGGNGPRLLAAKTRYDPDGVFTATPLPTPGPVDTAASAT